MENDAKVEALQWEVTKDATPSPKTWVELVRATTAMTSVDAVQRANAVTLVYERALRVFPSSYKLWIGYLKFRQLETGDMCSPNEWFQSVREVYERAVTELPNMPLLWLGYVEFVMASRVPRVTMTRHVFARALATLPATQHHLLWKVAKKWCSAPAVPGATVRAVWRFFLSFQRSLRAKREYFQVLVEKKDYNSFLQECVHLGLPQKLTKDNVEGRDMLLADVNFWETVQTALQAKGWRFTGDVAELGQLIALGQSRCASPVELSMAFSVFLYGQGYMQEGRRELRRSLEEAPEARTFTTLYQLAVEVEDQLVESFAVDPAIRLLDDDAYMRVVQHLFSSADPLTHLASLSREFPLLLNQAQLRNSPYNAALWLKRAELVQEDVYAGRSTAEDLQAVYRQAIQRCTAGMSRVDNAVAQLYHSAAQQLLRTGKMTEAVTLLHDGGWCVPFASTALNVQLVGLWVEVQLMASHAPIAVRDALADKLTTGSSAASGGGRAKRSRTGLLQSSAVLPEVVQHPHVWTLWCDVCAAVSGADEAAWQRLIDALIASKALSAEVACYVARKAYESGHAAVAVAVLDRSMVAFFGYASSAQLFMLEQHLSFLCLRHGTQNVPLHQFRELYSLVQQITPAALRLAPLAVMDLHFSCADMEAAIGLYGTAVRMVQMAAIAAVATLHGNADHLRLLQAALEHSISFTERYRGYDAVRTFCGDLVRRLQHPLLLQRVVLHWAAIEKRSGNVALAHTIMDACSDSQDPSSEHGAVYWRLWESLCTQRTEFENVARRRQQASIRFAESTSIH